MTRPEFLLLNGQLVKYDQARVHVLSTAFKFGITVFEGFRAYWSAEQSELYAFRMADHFTRLGRSSRIARIPLPASVSEMQSQLLTLMAKNGIREDCHMRIQVYVDADDARSSATGPVSVAMAAVPMGRYHDAPGMHVAVSSWARIDDRSMPPRVKIVSNYFNSRLALTQANSDGYDSAILLTTEGHVSEGPAYNVFLVRDDTLITPAITDGILEGVTRSSVIDLAGDLGIPVVERAIDRTELYLADELFFCGSAAEVLPVLSVDRHPVGAGEPGRVTRAIAEAYFAAVRGQSPKRRNWLTPVYSIQRQPLVSA